MEKVPDQISAVSQVALRQVADYFIAIIGGNAGPDAQRARSHGVKILCAVKRRRFSVGETPTRQRVAPAGSNQSDGGGNKFVEAFDATNRLGRFSEQVGRNASER